MLHMIMTINIPAMPNSGRLAGRPAVKFIVAVFSELSPSDLTRKFTWPEVTGPIIVTVATVDPASFCPTELILFEGMYTCTR